MTTYNIDVQTPETPHRGPATQTLRVVGDTPNQAIMGAYNYLVRQYDGEGTVCESSLRYLDGRKVIQDSEGFKAMAERNRGACLQTGEDRQ